MMKKLFALMLAILMLMSLAACGGEEDGGKKAEPTEYNAGNVKVMVPGGWKALQVNNIFAEDPSSADPDKINVVKGGKTDADLFTCPYIQISHTDPSTTMVPPTKDFYDNAEDLEPITAGGMTWTGFKAESLGTKIAILWATDADGHQFQLSCFVEATKGSIKVTDADFLEILGSVQAVK